MQDPPTVRRDGLLPVLFQRGGGLCHGRAPGAEPGKAEEARVSEGTS